MSTEDGSGRARITGRGIGSARNGLPSDMLPSGRYEFGRSRPELRPPVPPPARPRPKALQALPRPSPEAMPRPARAAARQDAPEPARAPDAAEPALRRLPPVTSKDELEASDADCPECKGAKAGPWGEHGQVITCPGCDGTGERRAAPGPGPACEPEPLPGVAKPGRCRKCKYLTTAAGHKIACGDGAS